MNLTSHDGQERDDRPTVSEPEPAHPTTVGPPRRRRDLTCAKVGAAALEVGFAELSIVAVAKRLGVSHTAIYRHVEDRDDLVLAAAEHLAATVDWPAHEGGWRKVLEAEAFTIWDAFARHPGLMPALDAAGRAPAAVMERFARTCAHLVAAGFDPADAMLAVDTVYDLAVDASTRSSTHQQRPTAEKDTMIEDWSTPLDHGELQRSLAAAITGAPRDWFADKLELVLDGVETRRRRRRRARG